mmetsp:Transcript_64766/g.138746  ORF Transcript_64766/g.138746 Transcript_64766/m.138746 type:complete len:240 (+) Transcript_64766:225-944(+)
MSRNAVLCLGLGRHKKVQQLHKAHEQEEPRRHAFQSCGPTNFVGTTQVQGQGSTEVLEQARELNRCESRFPFSPRRLPSVLNEQLHTLFLGTLERLQVPRRDRHKHLMLRIEADKNGAGTAREAALRTAVGDTSKLRILPPTELHQWCRLHRWLQARCCGCIHATVFDFHLYATCGLMLPNEISFILRIPAPCSMTPPGLPLRRQCFRRGKSVFLKRILHARCFERHLLSSVSSLRTEK